MLYHAFLTHLPADICLHWTCSFSPDLLPQLFVTDVMQDESEEFNFGSFSTAQNLVTSRSIWRPGPITVSTSGSSTRLARAGCRVPSWETYTPAEIS